MSLDLSLISSYFPGLLQPAIRRADDIATHRLKLPTFQPGREFEWAELRLPKGFPHRAKAVITLSPDAVLRIPHLDRDGDLCVEGGDLGPSMNLSPEDRVLSLLTAYYEQFLNPWLSGALDGDFEQEALNYWFIEVARARSRNDPVREVWTVDACPTTALIREGRLLLPNRIIIVGDEQIPITNRLVQSMGVQARQRIRVLVADIPISYPLTPQTWPRTTSELDLLLDGRLDPAEYDKFHSQTSRRGHSVHRLVLLRCAEYTFAYLLPGGPPTVVDDGRRKKAYPTLRKPLPLNAMRLDPAWTVGRDQHPEVEQRQEKHVLVLGNGALGSPVIDHLAKAGIGFITVIDPDHLSPANIGRHLLGAESIGKRKVNATAQRISFGYPATVVSPCAMTVERWLETHSLADFDAVLDLTGEPDVRWHIERARQVHACPLLIGWMEPYVAAAHVCLLPAGTPWAHNAPDPLTTLQAVSWPEDVIQREPGCSSQFQSYTAAAAGHAVALVAESALALIDNTNEVARPSVVSWVRGQRFLDRHRAGLRHRDWASAASQHDGLILVREFP